jgi:hypothetical protein
MMVTTVMERDAAVAAVSTTIATPNIAAAEPAIAATESTITTRPADADRRDREAVISSP